MNNNNASQFVTNDDASQFDIDGQLPVSNDTTKKKKRGRPPGSSTSTQATQEITELKNMMALFMQTVNTKIDGLERELKNKTGQRRLSTSSTPLEASPQVVMQPTNVSPIINLPQQKLPHFNGNIVEWTSFWQHFCYAVHNVSNATIPPINKLIYLLDCLSGTPKNMVKQLPLVDSSYLKAVTILTTEFGDNNRIIKSLHNRLQMLPMCKDTSIDLRKFIDELEQILLHLQELSVVNVLSVLVIVEKKLPMWLTEKLITLETENPALNIHDVIKCLRNALRIKEATQEYSTHSSNLQPSFNRHQLRPSSDQQRHVSTTFRPPPNNNLACLLCDNSSHKTSSCPRYSDVRSRINRLKDLRRCTKCLKPGHIIQNCSNNPTCFRCKGAHSSVVCDRNTSSHRTNFASNYQLDRSTTAAIQDAIISEANSTPLFQQRQVVQQPSTTNTSLASVVAPNDKKSTIFEANTHQTTNSTASTLLKCIKARVFNSSNPSISSEAFILFDDGSTTSYITNELANELSLSSESSDVLKLNVFSDVKTHEVKSNGVRFSVALSDDLSVNVFGYTLPHLTPSLPYSPARHNHLESDQLVIVDATPDILIGSDFYYEFDIQPAKKLSSGFTLVDSEVGSMICGKGNSTYDISAPRHNGITLHSFSSSTTYDASEINTDTVDKYFSLESIGITDDPVKKEENAVIKEFKDSLKFKNNRYQVSLPWKDNVSELGDSYGLAFGRLKSVFKKLQENPFLLNKYHQIIKEQLDLDIIEKCNARNSDGPMYYLPHQPVWNEEKQKLRIVYDASAKSSKSKYSLNECLLPGPLMLESLVGMLLRFRLPKFIVSCDIEKAFLQVSLRPEDRNVTRFLWIQDINKNLEQQQVIAYRFKRIAFGLTCSPFLLAAVLQHHFKHSTLPVAKEILHNTYVDNIFICAETVSDAQLKCKQAKELLKSCTMNLREFSSNSSDAIINLDSDDKLQMKQHKVLGVLWNNDIDTIVFISPTIPKNVKTWSKRLILSFIASIFDPLGLLIPTTLHAKLFLQSLWIQKLDWDTPLSDVDASNWQRILNHYFKNDVQIPRKVSSTSSDNYYELHIFSDASTTSFACCAYLIAKNKENNVRSSSLIFAKMKVKPNRYQKLSIHRLELLGATIAATSVQFLRKELNNINVNTPVYLWTDSSTVLHWLNSSVKQETFVENRLKIIRSIKDTIIQYVASEDNPADLATRGVKSEDFQSCKLWWHGPQWLASQQFEWPRSANIPNFNPSTTQLVNVCTTTTVNYNIFKRISNWSTLVSTTGYVLRFIRKCSKNKRFTVNSSFSTTKLTVIELRQAKLQLFKYSQLLSPPTDNEIRDLNLQIDTFGIYRCHGRLHNSSLSKSSIFPIFCPRSSSIIQLWIYYIHRLLHHSGATTTLAYIRENCWISKGRRTVTQIIRNFCLACRKQSAKPFVLPSPPPLPTERVTSASPFARCGIDYFGPISARNNKEVIKVWGAIFTCLVTRAIHIEIVTNLSAESFLNALKRFTARRGFTEVIYSDNGTQFVLSAKALKDIAWEEFHLVFNSDLVQNYLKHNEITWKFITERAPWRGGFFERMIGLVKNHIKRTVGKNILSLDVLTTLLIEIESVVNQRPITYLSENVNEPSPLRPIDFLLPMSNNRSFYPTIEDSDDFTLSDNNRDKLMTTWKQMSQRLDKFWKTWHKDYLLSIREKQRHQMSPSTQPIIGDIVLIEGDNLPRSCWKTGIITSIQSSDDDKVRTATVRTPNGRELNRSISQLYSLEISA